MELMLENIRKWEHHLRMAIINSKLAKEYRFSNPDLSNRYQNDFKRHYYEAELAAFSEIPNEQIEFEIEFR